MKLFAARCPRCGRTRDNTKKALIGLIGIQVVLLALYVRGEWSWDVVGGGPDIRRVALQTSPSATQAATRSKVPDAPAGWLYFQTTDSLVGDSTRHARLLSDSNHGAGNAGDRGTTGVIELRSSPLYGNSLVLTMKRTGSDLTDGHSEVEARFDGEDPVTFMAEIMTEGDTNVLIISDYPAFVARILKSRLMVLDAKLKGGAEQIIMFDVAGLVWG